MPLPFDATLKDLVRRHPEDFEAVLGLRGPGPPAVLNVDLSLVTAATDVVIGHGDPPALLIDLNFQASRDPGLARRLLLYDALLHHRHGVPVHSAVVLLRPEADDAALTGRVAYAGQTRRGRTDFRYEVVRLWQVPVRRLLRGGIGALPLALLGEMPEGTTLPAAMAAVRRRIERRLARGVSGPEAAHVLTAAFVLSGLRLSEAEAARVFQGVRAVEESTTYQYILRQGAIGALRKTLLRLGRQQFGPPTEAAEATINGITEVPRLERMIDRVLQATSWQDLLDTP